MANEGGGGGGAALHRLKSIDPPLWLTPSPELSQTARTASQHLFSSLKPFCPKSYFDTLLIQGFDPEQIWQQIDLQTEPLIANLTRDVKRFQKNPRVIPKLFGGEIAKKSEASKKKSEEPDEESEGDDDDEGFDDVEDEENGDFDEEDEDEEESEEEEEEGIEDKFLKISELEKYMEEDEAREYGVSKEKDTAHSDDDDEEDDEVGDVDDDSDEEIRYEDFYGVKKKRGLRRELGSHDGLGGDVGKKSVKRESKPRGASDNGDKQGDFGKKSSKRESKLSDASDDEDELEDNNGLHNQTNESLSTHEKQLEKLRSKIKQMEQANLDPKTWTMQGEVTASKRPYDSALGEYLDFEHNVRPVPEKSEETQASLEELIIKRIIEGQFDDVQKTSLPSRAPKEIKELDENKSKKGLAEIYEEEYVQQTGLGTGPLSSSDELKKEAQQLFDKLCLKLDALSHFHFKPKPVIEDMSIQTNVPALAMEEIAPVAVSDAAMLAPEEVFAGKGDIKEEAELTQAERKRRRATKKRKFKAENSKREAKKARDKASIINSNGKEELQF